MTSFDAASAGRMSTESESSSTGTSGEASSRSLALSLTEGGPLYRLERFLRVAPPTRTLRLLIAAGALCWASTLALSLFDGALGRSMTLLELLGFHARSLVGVPLLVMADILLGTRVERGTTEMVRQRIIDGDDVALWSRMVTRLERWRDLVFPELLPFVLVIAVVVVGVQHSAPTRLLPWVMPLFHGAPDDARSSLAWWWYVLVVQPVFLFLLLRFLWHWLLWSIALVSFARMNLRVQASHPDRAAGIGFLASPVDAFGVVVLAAAVVVSSTWADEIAATGTKAARFAPQFVGMVAASIAIPLAPYLPMSLLLMRAKLLGARAYGQLSREYIRAFDAKWLAPRNTERSSEGKQEHSAELLGAADFQSLADVGNAFSVVDQMRTTVFSKSAIVKLFALAVGPVVPLLLSRMPAVDIARRLLRFLG